MVDRLFNLQPLYENMSKHTQWTALDFDVIPVQTGISRVLTLFGIKSKMLQVYKILEAFECHWRTVVFEPERFTCL